MGTDFTQLVGLGLNAVGTGMGLFPGTKNAADDQVYININDRTSTTDSVTYNRMTAAEKKAWLTYDQFAMRDEQLKQQAVYDTEKGKLDKTLGDIGALDISGELENYEKDLFDSFMETASPAVRQWAFERGVAGGTPDVDLMTKTVGEGQKQASQGKYALQNQFNTQKENAKTTAMNVFKTGTALPTNLLDFATKGILSGSGMNQGVAAGADWANALKGFSKTLSDYALQQSLYNSQKTSPKDEVNFNPIIKDPLSNYKIGGGGYFNG